MQNQDRQRQLHGTNGFLSELVRTSAYEATFYGGDAVGMWL